jgi:hypothetical protein
MAFKGLYDLEKEDVDELQSAAIDVEKAVKDLRVHREQAEQSTANGPSENKK